MKHANVVVMGLFVLGTFVLLFMCQAFSSVKFSSLDTDGVTVGTACTGKFASKTKKDVCPALPAVPCSPQDRIMNTMCAKCLKYFRIRIPDGECPPSSLDACSASDGNMLNALETGTSVETKVIGGCGSRPGNSCSKGQPQPVDLDYECRHCGDKRTHKLTNYSSCNKGTAENNDNHCGDRDSTKDGC